MSRAPATDLTVLTLGVDDLAIALRFYTEGLGLSADPRFGTADPPGAGVAFLALPGGLTPALWPRVDLAADAGLPVGEPSPAGMSLGHNVADSAAVDAVVAGARAVGARVVREPAPTFLGGYAGYFQDPDEHLWEIVVNPALEA